jgi:hypothetical protein
VGNDAARSTAGRVLPGIIAGLDPAIYLGNKNK